MTNISADMVTGSLDPQRLRCADCHRLVFHRRHASSTGHAKTHGAGEVPGKKAINNVQEFVNRCQSTCKRDLVTRTPTLNI